MKCTEVNNHFDISDKEEKQLASSYVSTESLF